MDLSVCISLIFNDILNVLQYYGDNIQIEIALRALAVRNFVYGF